MLGSRYVAGWVVVAGIATTVGVGTLVFVRGAVEGSAVVNALSPSDVVALYSAAVQSAAAHPSPSSSSRPNGHGPTPTSGPSSHGGPSSSPPPPLPSGSSGSITKLLTSQGGSVLAQCSTSGGQGTVYLVSWSPAQGYSIDHAQRGPSVEAEIEWGSGEISVSVQIHCTQSGPVQAIQTDTSWGGGGGGDD